MIYMVVVKHSNPLPFITEKSSFRTTPSPGGGGSLDILYLENGWLQEMLGISLWLCHSTEGHSVNLAMQGKQCRRRKRKVLLIREARPPDSQDRAAFLMDGLNSRCTTSRVLPCCLDDTSCARSDKHFFSYLGPTHLKPTIHLGLLSGQICSRFGSCICIAVFLVVSIWLLLQLLVPFW